MFAHLLPTVAVVLILSVSQAAGQEWARKMFDTLDHDFETVARGSDTEFKFRVKNIYKEDVHIESVRSSCGCTNPSIENDSLATYEEGYIVAKFNTRTFTGLHSATLTVTFDKPYQAQVQLRVHGNIRGDVVFEPGSATFDAVDQGTLNEKQVTVRYAGRSGWKINDVVVASDASEHFEVELKETERVGGRVVYNLLVRLKETAPAGYLKDQLVLVTNDDRNPRIPLDVEGRIVPAISVAPENLVFGELKQGAKMAKKIVVRGKQPFSITGITGGDGSLGFGYGQGEQTTHIVDVTLHAPSQSGRYKQTIAIETSLGASFSANCMAFATILASPEVDAASGSNTADDSNTRVDGLAPVGLANGQ